VHGAKVIHPRAVEIGWRHGIPIKVKCTFSDEPGTTISSHPDGAIERPKGQSLIGIAHQSDHGYLVLRNADPDISDRVGGLLGKMSAASVDTDYLNVSRRDMEFTADATVVETVARLGLDAGMELANKLGGGARITLVCGSAGNVSSLTNSFIDLLRQEHIDVLQVFAGPSAISGIVDGKDMVAAIRALHENLFESQILVRHADDPVMQ
jgi:aspartate kinase